MALKQGALSQSHMVSKRHGVRTRSTIAMVELEPDMIDVRHALSTYPVYTTMAVQAMAQKEEVPINCLQYVLSWGNKLRINDGESHFDVPNSKALIGMMNVFAKKFTKSFCDSEENHDDSLPEVATVSMADYRQFLQQFDDDVLPDRTTIMTALDEFVGQHL